MPRVVPSQVVEYLHQRNIPTDLEKGDKSLSINASTRGYLSGLTYLIDEIPSEYITISGQDYSNLVFATQSINTAVKSWKMGTNTHSLALQPYREESLLALIRDSLSKCPDTVPDPSTTDLPFIDDEPMRNSIRTDLSSAANALHNGEWKSATVLAGSVCEALLLWALPKAKNYDPTQIKNSKGEPCNPEDLDLVFFIEKASSWKLITTGTRDIVQRARNYRNLIHPGRAKRFEQECDRASALVALAAAEAIIRNLKMACDNSEGMVLTDKQLSDDRSQYASK